jgi:hypothetical protein
MVSIENAILVFICVILFCVAIFLKKLLLALQASLYEALIFHLLLLPKVEYTWTRDKAFVTFLLLKQSKRFLRRSPNPREAWKKSVFAQNEIADLLHIDQFQEKIILSVEFIEAYNFTLFELYSLKEKISFDIANAKFSFKRL